MRWLLVITIAVVVGLIVGGLLTLLQFLLHAVA